MIASAILAKEKAIIPYVTAGLPGLDLTGEIIAAFDEAGVAAIEIGIPFSDPMADGPVLQKASHKALQAGFTMDKLLQHLGKWSASVQAPLIIMSYINPLLRHGLRETLVRLKDNGIQGVIIPDLPSKAGEIYELCQEIKIDLVRLVAPTTPMQRQEEVVSQCGGFVYAVTIKGVTGARSSLPKEIREQVTRLKALTDLPVCVGFGVSDARQVEEMLTFADGVIVGSFIMDKIMNSLNPVKGAYEALNSLMNYR